MSEDEYTHQQFLGRQTDAVNSSPKKSWMDEQEELHLKKFQEGFIDTILTPSPPIDVIKAMHNIAGIPADRFSEQYKAAVDKLKEDIINQNESKQK